MANGMNGLRGRHALSHVKGAPNQDTVTAITRHHNMADYNVSLKGRSTDRRMNPKRMIAMRMCSANAKHYGPIGARGHDVRPRVLVARK